jgi:hypothetical protein
MSDLDNFKAWYVDVLTPLYPHRNAGIAVFMLSLPLEERYLRQKNNAHRAEDDSKRVLSMKSVQWIDD